MRAEQVMPSRPPRLLHFADYGASYAGSFIPMAAALARAATERGWAVELVFSETARGKPWLAELEREKIAHRFIDLGSAAGPARWIPSFAAEATRGRWLGRVDRAIADLLAQDPRGPTLLHTQFTMFDVPAAEAARRAPQAHVVWHEQSARPGGRFGELGGTLRYRLFGRDVGAIVCVAPDIAETVSRQGAAGLVTVLPNAVDTTRFGAACLSERAVVRERLGVAPGTAVLLHFGAHWQRKGGDVFLAAVHSLRTEPHVLELRAFVVGSAEARAAVEAAGLGERVTVLPPAERVEDLYAAADVFVSPSRAEGMPFAVLEALSVGVPVVASDIPGQAAIGQAVAACHLSPLEPEALAAVIRDVLAADPLSREREQREARDWIAEHAGLDSWTAAIMDTYDRILDGAARR